MIPPSMPSALTDVAQLMRQYALFHPRSQALADVNEIATVASVHVAAVGDSVRAQAEALAPGFGDVED